MGGRLQNVRPGREGLQKAVDLAASVLGSGGVLVMPTDSVYGIGCAAFEGNPAHARVFDIKRRDRSQPLPLLVAGRDGLVTLGQDVPAWACEMAARFWPGALTLVVRASDAVPEEYRAADGSIALRCPDSDLVCDVARRIGMPLAVTSANTHGHPAPASAGQLEVRIIDEADLTLDAGPTQLGMASTIVSCLGDAPIVLRKGAVTSTDLLG